VVGGNDDDDDVNEDDNDDGDDRMATTAIKILKGMTTYAGGGTKQVLVLRDW